MRLVLAIGAVLAMSTATVRAETPQIPTSSPTSPVTPAMTALADDLAGAELFLRHAREDIQKLVSEAVARESAARGVPPQQKGVK